MTDDRPVPTAAADPRSPGPVGRAAGAPHPWRRRPLTSVSRGPRARPQPLALARRRCVVVGCSSWARPPAPRSCSPAAPAIPPCSRGRRPTASPTRSSAWTSRATSPPSSAKIMKAFPGFDDQAAFPIKLSRRSTCSSARHRTGSRATRTTSSRGSAGRSASASARSRRRPTRRPRAGSSCSASRTPPRRRPGPTAWPRSGRHDHHRDLQRRDDHPRQPGRRRRAGREGMKAAYAVVGPVLAARRPDVRQGGDRHRRQDGPRHQRAVPGPPTASVTRRPRSASPTSISRPWPRARRTLAGRRRPTAMPRCRSRSRAWPPPWVAGAVRAEDGAFVMESRSPHLARPGPANNAESEAAGRRCRRPPWSSSRATTWARPSSSVKDQLAEDP